MSVKKGFFLAKAYGKQSLIRDAEIHQVLFGGLGSSFPQSHVVLIGTALITVALNGNDDSRVGAQEVAIALKSCFLVVTNV